MRSLRTTAFAPALRSLRTTAFAPALLSLRTTAYAPALRSLRTTGSALVMRGLWKLRPTAAHQAYLHLRSGCARSTEGSTQLHPPSDGTAAESTASCIYAPACKPNRIPTSAFTAAMGGPERSLLNCRPQACVRARCGHVSAAEGAALSGIRQGRESGNKARLRCC
ncbi:hypothetical protein GCM10011588_46400 [Nocardia jinanensis]|uniref:Uncharacterized protein n=1 Tax=Nocardia jinanensis TaxID=382504 RepID=A0A917RSN9_9NOCA|nr:hypothetical protein GCM10011588_46400 [Nocardia jinanensis]